MLSVLLVLVAIIYFIVEAKKRQQPILKWGIIALLSFITPQLIFFWFVYFLLSSIFIIDNHILLDILMMVSVLGFLSGFYLLFYSRNQLFKHPKKEPGFNDLIYWKLTAAILIILSLMAISNNGLINKVVAVSSDLGKIAEYLICSFTGEINEEDGKVSVSITFTGKDIENLFNGKSDDIARAYTKNDCSVISGDSDAALIALILIMMDGPTGDEDERAILKILKCISCDRVRSILNIIGGRKLRNEFQGREYDLLMIRLQECEWVNFSQWDDDATRLYIKQSSCEVLRSLTNEQINQLLRNLFEGFTGDADEKRIIELMECLPCSRRKEIMQMEGSKYRRFENEVNGSEWDILKPILKCND